MDCKKRFPTYVMDFDHVRGKKSFNISSAQCINIGRLLVEIIKCDLVCSNCHRRRTYKRGWV